MRRSSAGPSGRPLWSPDTTLDLLYYIGRYTSAADPTAAGITLARRDPDGGLTPVGETASANASFLARHPTLPRMYAVNEIETGTVSTFAIAEDGGLSLLAVHSSAGADPCHLAVDPGGSRLTAANYSSGTVVDYRLDPDGIPVPPGEVVALKGSGPHPRQGHSRAHQVHHTAEGTVLVVDLGGDRVHRFRGLAEPVDPPWSARPGTGPRHLAGDGLGHWYATGELDNVVVAYAEQPDGSWRETARHPASSAAAPNQPSHLALSPDGRFLYAANRGPDSITVFGLRGGVPEPIAEVPSGGSGPRHFVQTGEDLWVANEASHSVTLLRVDPRTGIPSEPSHALSVTSPVCILPVAAHLPSA